MVIGGKQYRVRRVGFEPEADGSTPSVVGHTPLAALYYRGNPLNRTTKQWWRRPKF
jgi:hypothetical protein